MTRAATQLNQRCMNWRHVSAPRAWQTFSALRPQRAKIAAATTAIATGGVPRDDVPASTRPGRPLMAGQRKSRWMRCPIVSKHHVSVCSAIYSASSTAMPSYCKELSNLVCPRRGWAARRLFVHRWLSVAFVRRMVRVPYVAGAKPIDTIRLVTLLAYCRVARCRDFVTLPGNW